MIRTASLTATIRRAAVPLTGAARDYDALLTLVGDARVVLLGEASHGTHEFYRERARITRRLIEEKNFTIVAAEADWPDAYRVNRFVRGAGEDAASIDALADFRRFPAWMWRNADVLDFVDWLRQFDDHVSPTAAAGFYGLDLYSLGASTEAVLAYLETVDPDAAVRARRRYACFDHAEEGAPAYGRAATLGLRPSCEDEVVDQLVDLRRHASDYARRDGRIAADAFFAAEQNARVVQNAERYYRTMFRGRDESWNVRDRHMAETLDALLRHFNRPGAPARAVVWAHNSHVGDARATSMAERGELNIGQLARERYGRDAVAIGFTTYHGTVTAASDWGAPAERKRVRPALPGSCEAVFHEVGEPRFLLPLRTREIADALAPRRLERAIGVIYLPRTERISHYFDAALPEQFDAVIHIDETRAVAPLERTAEWEAGSFPGPIRGRCDMAEQDVEIAADRVTLHGDLVLPPDALGLVIFAHGSGSSRKSPRNRMVAASLHRARLATLLFDLLTRDEEAVDRRTAHLRFDIRFLAERLTAATDWAKGHGALSRLSFGYFGASTGAGAALVAAAERPAAIAAVVSRGGRPDLAGSALPRVLAPTLLIIGGDDVPVIDLNERARALMLAEVDLRIVPGASHLFEEPGALEEVARLASAWFTRCLARRPAA